MLMALGVGACFILAAYASLFVQLLVSASATATNRVPGRRPVGRARLEWSISAPPPEYNFAFLPQVTARDAFTIVKGQRRRLSNAGQVRRHRDGQKQRHGDVLCVTGALMAFA